MTGRDLIIYILENHLEDTDLFEDGPNSLFMTETEAAVKYHIGSATIKGWLRLGMISGFKVGETTYILRNTLDPRVGFSVTTLKKEDKNE